ncbi:MAG: class I SAM-dependent methyltransferase [Acidobacteriota bacterium]
MMEECQPQRPPTSERCRAFLLADVSVDQRVLDVGCGEGGLMVELSRRGISVTGIEIDPSLVGRCRAMGLDVAEGRAEALPIHDGGVDAVVCSVVLPYTDERRAVAEWARVLAPGGSASASCHGCGYGFDYLCRGRGWRQRFYGFRMLANTVVYRLTGRRLPGFLGDTLCQSSGQLKSYYRAFGLTLERELVVGAFLGAPLFLCHRVVKSREPTGAQASD